MKFAIKILAAIAVLGAALSTRAQFDNFNAVRSVQVIPPQFISASASNGFVCDTHNFMGIAQVLITSPTNSINTTNTNCVFIAITSQDRTNWSLITNCAIAVSNSVIYTNNTWGTGNTLYATNDYNLTFNPVNNTPGSLATATNGYATPSPSYYGFTNSSTFTNTGAPILFGYNIQDQGRYLMIECIITGSSTNAVSATLTATPKYQ